MPTRATMEAATPKCPYDGPPISVPGMRPPVGKAGRPCRRPLRYDAQHDLWICPAHGGTITGSALVQRQREFRVSDEAA